MDAASKSKPCSRLPSRQSFPFSQSPSSDNRLGNLSKRLWHGGTSTVADEAPQADQQQYEFVFPYELCQSCIAGRSGCNACTVICTVFVGCLSATADQDISVELHSSAQGAHAMLLVFSKFECDLFGEGVLGELPPPM